MVCQRAASGVQGMNSDLRSVDRDDLLRSIVELAPEAIVTINTDGKVLSFSPAGETMFGYHHDEIEGRPLTMLMPERDAAVHQKHIASYLQTGEAHIIGHPRILSARRKTGETFPVRLTVGEAGQGAERVFIGFIEDVTRQEDNRRKLDTALVEIERVSRLSTLGEMAASLAHDLNQPLTGAMSSADAIDLVLEREGLPGDHPARRGVERCLDDLRRLSELVRDVTSFLKTGEVQKRHCDLNALVREATLLASAGADRSIAFKFQLDDALPPGAVDPVQIRQVVVNLVRNAVEALEDAPEKSITISTGHHDDGVEITVSDTGGGMTPELAEHVFEPLVSSKPGGLGLGLAIARRMVEAHQGELSVEIPTDDRAGHRTVFRVVLPLAQSDDP